MWLGHVVTPVPRIGPVRKKIERKPASATEYEKRIVEMLIKRLASSSAVVEWPLTTLISSFNIVDVFWKFSDPSVLKVFEPNQKGLAIQWNTQRDIQFNPIKVSYCLYGTWCID